MGKKRSEARGGIERSACWGLVWLCSGHEGPFRHNEWNGGVKREKKLGGERGVALYLYAECSTLGLSALCHKQHLSFPTANHSIYLEQTENINLVS